MKKIDDLLNKLNYKRENDSQKFYSEKKIKSNKSDFNIEEIKQKYLRKENNIIETNINFNKEDKYNLNSFSNKNTVNKVINSINNTLGNVQPLNEIEKIKMKYLNKNNNTINYTKNDIKSIEERINKYKNELFEKTEKKNYQIKNEINTNNLLSKYKNLKNENEIQQLTKINDIKNNQQEMKIDDYINLMKEKNKKNIIQVKSDLINEEKNNNFSNLIKNEKNEELNLEKQDLNYNEEEEKTNNEQKILNLEEKDNFNKKNINDKTQFKNSNYNESISFNLSEDSDMFYSKNFKNSLFQKRENPEFNYEEVYPIIEKVSKLKTIKELEEKENNNNISNLEEKNNNDEKDANEIINKVYFALSNNLIELDEKINEPKSGKALELSELENENIKELKSNLLINNNIIEKPKLLTKNNIRNNSKEKKKLLSFSEFLSKEENKNT